MAFVIESDNCAVSNLEKLEKCILLSHLNCSSTCLLETGDSLFQLTLFAEMFQVQLYMEEDSSKTNRRSSKMFYSV